MIKRVYQEGHLPLDDLYDPKNLQNKKLLSKDVTYTSMLFNTKPKQTAARAILFFIFFTACMIQGMVMSVSLDLQQRAIGYKKQAWVSVINYPYFLKIFSAPIMDTYFNKKVGKCKTWLSISCLIIAGFLIGVGPYFEELLDSQNLLILIPVLFFVVWAGLILKTTGQIWMTKIFFDQNLGDNTLFASLGENAGIFLAYNVFTPLSSLEWSNKHIFKSHPRSTPLLSFKLLSLFIGCCALSLALLCLVFVAEKVLPAPLANRTHSVGAVYKVFPKFFRSPWLQRLFLLLTFVMFGSSVVSNSLTFKLIDYGVKKTAIVNIDTLMHPFSFLAGCLLMRFLVKGKLMQRYFWMKLLMTLQLFLRIINITDLSVNNNYHRAIVIQCVTTFLEKVLMSHPFFLAFVTSQAPENIEMTFVTAVFCWHNLWQDFPSTIGLFIISQDWLAYPLFCFIVFGLHCCLLALSYPLAQRVDGYRKKYFDPENSHLAIAQELGAYKEPWGGNSNRLEESFDDHPMQEFPYKELEEGK